MAIESRFYVRNAGDLNIPVEFAPLRWLIYDQTLYPGPMCVCGCSTEELAARVVDALKLQAVRDGSLSSHA